MKFFLGFMETPMIIVMKFLKRRMNFYILLKIWQTK